LEQAHARHVLLTLAASLGALTCVRPLKWSVDVFSQVLGLSGGPDPRPRVGPVSDAWLRQHETESKKHRVGQ
jgi:hypothetical protein